MRHTLVIEMFYGNPPRIGLHCWPQADGFSFILRAKRYFLEVWWLYGRVGGFVECEELTTGTTPGKPGLRWWHRWSWAVGKHCPASVATSRQWGFSAATGSQS